MSNQPPPSQPPAPHPFSLLGIALARFTESLGDSNLNLNNDHQWSLKTAPFARDVFVLLYGPESKPIVWIFDPNDRNDGVSRSIIEGEAGIIDIIDHIRDRVHKAAHVPRRAQEPRQSKEDQDQDQE